MNFEQLLEQLSDLQLLVQGWSTNGELSVIEREIALDKIKRLYEELRFGEYEPRTPKYTSAAIEEPVPPMVIEQSEEPIVEETIIEDPVVEETFVSIELEDISIVADLETPIEMEVENLIPEIAEPQPKVELVPMAEPMAEPEPTPQPEIVAEIEDTPTPKVVSNNSLFDLNTIPIRTKKRRSAIMSLYSDGVKHPEPTPNVQPTPTPAPIPTPEPTLEIEELEEIEEFEELIVVEQELAPTSIVESKPQILGEVLSENIETIGELYATDEPSIGEKSSEGALSSINDRYLIAQELFEGDIAQCEDMLAELLDIDNFDDAMIYIVENYEWSADSEAVKLIIKSLEQKFQLN